MESICNSAHGNWIERFHFLKHQDHQDQRLWSCSVVRHGLLLLSPRYPSAWPRQDGFVSLKHIQNIFLVVTEKKQPQHIPWLLELPRTRSSVAGQWCRCSQLAAEERKLRPAPWWMGAPRDMVMAQGCAFGDRRRTTPDFAEKWCELVKNQWVIFFFSDLLVETSSGWWLSQATLLKNMSSSVGIMTFPIYGKIKFMFQTTNQYIMINNGIITSQSPWPHGFPVDHMFQTTNQSWNQWLLKSSAWSSGPADPITERFHEAQLS